MQALALDSMEDLGGKRGPGVPGVSIACTGCMRPHNAAGLKLPGNLGVHLCCSKVIFTSCIFILSVYP